MPDVTAKLSTALADRYRIERHLGSGGMATVYLAEDLKHDRKVAVKVLRAELAAVLGAERFIQEIKTTASLQHPNILPLFDSGEADGFLFYVMPYIEGETLRDKLNRETQLGIDEAVKITTEVAEALDSAHRQGVIHRDIKPENILLHDGRPMVADFGIALAVSAAAGGRMTETGLSLGTPHYMSPEQATAEKDLTHRSDIYSLGSVLYEMLTGEPPHMGNSAQQIIMKIVTEDVPPVTKLRKSVPPNVTAAVAKALEKLAADRFGSAAKFAEALTNAEFTLPTTPGVAVAGAPSRGPWRQAAIALGVLSFVVIGWAMSVAQRTAPVEVRRHRLEMPRASGRFIAALSPDGSSVVFALRDSAVIGSEARVWRLWTRTWDELELTSIPGTEGADSPSFSPDGNRVAFMAAGALKTVDVDGGSPPTTLLADIGFGWVNWGSDGFIYGAGNVTSLPTLWRVPEGGGAVDSITTRTPGQFHRDPHALPRERGVLFTISTAAPDPTSDSIGVLDLATGEHRVLLQGNSPSYVPEYLVYLTAAGQLMAAPFDLGALRVSAPPTIVVDNVAEFSISAAGDLLYTEGHPRLVVPELAWSNADGTSEPIDWPMEPGPLPVGPALSPDGTRLALRVLSGDSGRVLIKDLVGGTVTTVMGDGREGGPVWSADGREVGFVSDRQDGQTRLWRRRADGSGPPRQVTGPLPDDVRGFGRWSLDQPIVFSTNSGLASMIPGRDSVPVPILEEEAILDSPTISPDGRWVAFRKVVEGQRQIFVRPFPDADTRLVQVSLGGSPDDPTWSRDGRTLFYSAVVPRGRDIIAARVRTTPDFEVLSREPVASFQRGYTWGGRGWLFDAAPAGDRFVVVRYRVDLQVVNGLVLVENFFEELKAKVGN